MIQIPQLPMFRDPDTSDASLVAGWHFPGVRGTPHDVGGTHDGASTALTFLRTAGDYNGTTSVIRVADHADLRVTNNLTIRGWVRSASGVAGVMISRRDHGTPQTSWSAEITSNVFRVNVDDDGTGDAKRYQTTASAANGSWRQFGFTFASNTLVLYLDGRVAAVTKIFDNDVSTIYAGTEDLMIGASLYYNNAFSRFVSEIACVGMWNEVKPAAWFAQDYRNTLPDPSCVLMTTDGLTDLSAYGRTLTNHGLQRGTAGITCDGTGYVSAADVAALDIVDNLTVECVFSTGTAGAQIIAAKSDYGTANRGWTIGLDASGYLTVDLSDDGTADAGHRLRYSGAVNLADGNNHSAGFTFATGALSLYVDGAVLVSPTVVDGDEITAIFSGAAALFLGCWLNSGAAADQLTGSVKLAAVYNEVKSAAWVAQRYAQRQATTAGYPWKFTVNTTGSIDPVVSAEELADADVTWTRPDDTAFTGKAPASELFTMTGEYTLSLTDWEKMTRFDFKGDAISGDISGWTLPSSLQYLYLYSTSVSYGTGNALDGLTTAIAFLGFDNCGWDVDEVDRALADCVDSGLSGESINVAGTNAAPTSVADPSSYWTLVEDRGWVISVTTP